MTTQQLIISFDISLQSKGFKKEYGSSTFYKKSDKSILNCVVVREDGHVKFYNPMDNEGIGFWYNTSMIKVTLDEF